MIWCGEDHSAITAVPENILGLKNMSDNMSAEEFDVAIRHMFRKSVSHIHQLLPPLFIYKHCKPEDGSETLVAQRRNLMIKDMALCMMLPTEERLVKFADMHIVTLVERTVRKDNGGVLRLLLNVGVSPVQPCLDLILSHQEAILSRQHNPLIDSIADIYGMERWHTDAVGGDRLRICTSTLGLRGQDYRDSITRNRIAPNNGSMENV